MFLFKAGRQVDKVDEFCVCTGSNALIVLLISQYIYCLHVFSFFRNFIYLIYLEGINIDEY